MGLGGTPNVEMGIGYATVSTVDQHPELRLEAD